MPRDRTEAGHSAAAISLELAAQLLGVSVKTVYRLIAKEPMHIDEREFLRRISERMGQNNIQGRYWLDAFRDVLFACLAENASVDLNFLHAKLHVAGSLNSPTAQPTKDGNPVLPRVFLKGELTDALAAFDVVNDTLTVNAILYEIQQDGVAELNRIESPTARVVVNGNAIRIDPTEYTLAKVTRIVSVVHEPNA